MIVKNRCPSCGEAIPDDQIKEYLENGETQCPYCCKTLEVRMVNSIFASALVGGGAGAALGLFTKLDLMYVIILSMIITVVLDRYLELILFRLTEKNDLPPFR